MKLPASSRNVNERGFTLMELVIVIALIIIILLVVLVNMSMQLAKSRDAKRKTDLRTMQKALEEYFNDNNTYIETNDLSTCGGKTLDPYLAKVPCDPVKKNAYYYQTGMPTARDGYVLCAALENKTDPDIIRIGCDADAGCGWGEGYNYCVTSGAVTASRAQFAGVVRPPTSTPTGTPTATPTETPPPGGTWQCTPQGLCNQYGNPVGAGCPFSYSKGCTFNGVYQCGNINNRCLYNN